MRMRNKRFSEARELSDSLTFLAEQPDTEKTKSKSIWENLGISINNHSINKDSINSFIIALLDIMY